jgi:hypothetical protein
VFLVEFSAGRTRRPAGIRRKRPALVSSCDSNPGGYIASPGRPSKNLRYTRARGRRRSRVWNRPSTGSPSPAACRSATRDSGGGVPKLAEAHCHLVLQSRGRRAGGLSPFHHRVPSHDRGTHIKPLELSPSGNNRHGGDEERAEDRAENVEFLVRLAHGDRDEPQPGSTKAITVPAIATERVFSVRMPTPPITSEGVAAAAAERPQRSRPRSRTRRSAGTSSCS